MANIQLTQPFLNPRSIAIVGASSNPQKTGSRIQSFLLKHNYRGQIFPVNPKRKEIFGIKAYQNLKSINNEVDHVFIALDGNKILDIIKDAISINVKCATILSGGFSETGTTGKQLERNILKLAKKGNLRILGPNSIGIINISDSVVMSANAMLDLPDLKKGSLGVISQSGSLIGAILSHGASKGIGFSKLISVGNESDISIGEIGKILVNDQNTDTILLFLETLRNNQEVAEMARLANLSGKPVIVYKLGKSELGKELAKSHTGAIAGSDDAFNAFIKKNGMTRVHIFETLIEIPNLFKNKRRAFGKRVGIITTTGGGGAMVVEGISDKNIEVINPGTSMSKVLKKYNIPYNNNKLVDLTIAGTKPEIVNEVISVLMNNKNCDLVIMIVGSSAKFKPEQAIEPLLKWAKNSKPLAVYVAPDAPKSLELLNNNGIACFRTPESCSEGIKAFLNTTKPKLNLKPKFKKKLDIVKNILKDKRTKNLTEFNALKIFNSLGINVVESKVCVSRKEIMKTSNEFGFPLVMKIHSDKILHKTEVNGVILNINSKEDLLNAFNDLSKTFNKLKVHDAEKKILLQKMEKGIAEIILGYRVDQLVGPIIVIGTGGIFSEVYNDKSVRLAPVGLNEAKTMINEVKGLISIKGYRGLPKVDINKLAQSIVNMSQLYQLEEIVEAEMNPVLIKEDSSIVGVDGLITLSNTSI
jgi:acyl-CoA synthetase (NDP forming)